MKQPFIILSSLLLFTGLTFTKSADSLIQEINTKYQYSQKNITSYDTTQIDIWDESTEGGYCISYSEKKNIILINVVLFGEMGRQKIDYFFDNYY
jgi:hypothetical protein